MPQKNGKMFKNFKSALNKVFCNKYFIILRWNCKFFDALNDNNSRNIKMLILKISVLTNKIKRGMIVSKTAKLFHQLNLSNIINVNNCLIDTNLTRLFKGIKLWFYHQFEISQYILVL